MRGANLSLRDIEDIILLEEREGRGYALAAEKLAEMRAALQAQLKRLDSVSSELAASAGVTVAA